MKRQPAGLSDSLSHRLNSYALAASAAGVGMLTLAQPAEGRIVYHHAHNVIGPGEHYALDLNHDGVTDFTLRNFYDRTGRSGQLSLSLASPWQGKEGVWASRSGYIASVLAARVRVDPKAPFASNRSEQMAAVFPGGSTFGPWCGTKDRYLGVKFLIGDATHFGWVRLNVDCTPTGVSATLDGYAYETIANKPIVTGKEHGADDGATLGRLALGRK